MVRGFLSLLHQMAGKTPRGMRPMMEKPRRAAGQTDPGRPAPLGHVRRTGTNAISTARWPISAEDRIVALGPAERASRHLFVDNQRKLNFYLRALWARAFLMRPTAGDYETRPA